MINRTFVGTETRDGRYIRYNRDLQAVAEDAWAYIRRGWQFVTRTLEDRYGLNEQQSHRVKMYLHRLSAQDGILWGWRPSDGLFELAKDAGAAREILEYAGRQWQNEGKSYDYMLEAANKQGFIADDQRQVSHIVWQEFDRQLDRLLSGWFGISEKEAQEFRESQEAA
jgi:hypothetical protein